MAKNDGMWQGRRIMDGGHAAELDHRAAVLEFGRGLTREAAEEQAHGEYVRDQHLNAAAHHLMGAKTAKAAGAIEEAQRHGALYSQHLKALGIEPIGPVPPEVTQRLQAQKGVYRFRGHGADGHLPQEQALTKSEAPRGRYPHPHAYEWHDGHTRMHMAGLAKADNPPAPPKPGAHPHMDAPPKPANEQAAGVGVSTYAHYAKPYGDIHPGTKSDLFHYDYRGKLPAVRDLVAQHGFQTYYAGGQYGKPDLANRNYNTKHLMVYDPTPSSGGDFGDRDYTDAWRQIHELSHALVYPELNKIYGEGRRIGKLGVQRSMREAKRAVHWEWLAAHKQRELSEQIGLHVPDEVFHKELNTVMHDAVHRAVTGKFTEPSDEGFVPSAQKVPLETALGLVDQAGAKMGLTHPDQVLKR